MPRLVTLVLMLTLLPVGAVTHATAPEDERAQAEELVDQGLVLARGGAFRDAIEKFEEANRLFPHPEIQHNLARAYEELHELRRAYYWFSQALKKDYTYAQDGRERLAKIEAELRKRYAHLTVRTTPSEVNVQLVFADGETESYLSTPFQTWAPAGVVKITGTNPEFKTGTRELQLAAGEERQVNLVLQPLPKQGFITVHANVPGAKVFLGEVLIGSLPMESVPYPAGIYDLKVTASGYQASKQQVVIQPDELTSVTLALQPLATRSPPPEAPADAAGGPPSWVGATLVGVGATTLIAAIVLHVEAFQTNAQANEIPISDPRIEADEARYRQLFGEAKDYQTYAAITYASAGVLIGTGVALLMLADDTPSEAGPQEATTGLSLRPRLAIAPDYVGAGALLSF